MKTIEKRQKHTFEQAYTTEEIKPVLEALGKNRFFLSRVMDAIRCICASNKAYSKYAMPKAHAEFPLNNQKFTFVRCYDGIEFSLSLKRSKWECKPTGKKFEADKESGFIA